VAWGAVALPATIGPVSREVPSPKSMCTFEMFAPAAGVTVNVTGVPAVVEDGDALNPCRLRGLTVRVAVPF